LQGQGTPGLVRGGSGAMESLLQSTSGREKLTARHVENGWFSAVIENTLVLSQMLAKDKQYLPSISYVPESKKNKFDFSEISRADIRRVYTVQLSFQDKLRNELSEMTRKSMIFDRAIQHEGVNRDELMNWFIGNDKESKRLFSGVDREENMRILQSLGKGGGEAPKETPITGGKGLTGGGLQV